MALLVGELDRMVDKSAPDLLTSAQLRLFTMYPWCVDADQADKAAKVTKAVAKLKGKAKAKPGKVAKAVAKPDDDDEAEARAMSWFGKAA